MNEGRLPLGDPEQPPAGGPSDGTGSLPEPASNDRLKGWKQIGTYLGVSYRTVQRWEETLNLPVHRIDTARSAVVFASKLELDAWERSAAGRAARRGSSTESGENAEGKALDAENPDGGTGGAVASGPGEPDLKAFEGERRARQRLRFRAWQAVPVMAALALASLYYVVGGVPRLSPAEQAPEQEPARPASRARGLPATRRSLVLRLTLPGGATFKAGVPIGGLGRLSIPGQPLRLLSVRVTDGQVFAHIYSVERDPAGQAEEMKEIVALPLEPNAKTDVDAASGIKAIEWLAPAEPDSAGPATTAHGR